MDTKVKHKERMRIMLLDAAKQFIFYARYHLAKDPPDIAKAMINIEFVKKCHAAVRNDKDE